MDEYFKEWTCTFPGKMGISWKRAWDGVGTKAEAEAQAAKNCNAVAVPLELFESMKDYEFRTVKAEAKLQYNHSITKYMRVVAKRHIDRPPYEESQDGRDDCWNNMTQDEKDEANRLVEMVFKEYL